MADSLAIKLPVSASHDVFQYLYLIDADARKALGITDGLVRLSVGIEDLDDLLGDLDQALGAIQTAPPPVYSIAVQS